MPHRAIPTWQRSFANSMRRHQTASEGLLWWGLRRRRIGVRFRRQHPMGRYIVDFVCLEHRLVVEVDGSQHRDEVDRDRDAWLAREGYMVMRFWAWDVMKDLDWVLGEIQIQLRDRGAQI